MIKLNNFLDSPKFNISLVIIFLLLCGIIFHLQYIQEYPMYTHTWAQSDRFSIALSFLDNNFNLFYPESHIYNPEFPYNWMVPNTEAIGSVDFPIHDYIAAILMKIFGSKSPGIFRLYTLIYSLVGLFFLFKLTLLLTKNYSKSLLITFLAATSPVFIFYQSGFLPSVPSLANVIIGYYFYLLFLETANKKNFYFAFAFLTIATLNRTSFAVPFVAIVCLEGLELLIKRKFHLYKFITLFISLGAIAGYYKHNQNLRNEYGSNFLNYLLPAKTWDEFYYILGKAWEFWGTEYFTYIHYFIALAIFLLVLVLLVLKKLTINALNKKFILLTGIYLIGTICFSYAMFTQFMNHDYYFLDSWFIPILFLVVALLSFIPNFETIYYKLGLKTGLIVLAYFTISFGIKHQKDRHSLIDWDFITKTSMNYDGASQFLDKLNVPKDAKILALDAYAPNIPFIHMDRKGFAMPQPTKEGIIEALKWNYSYITFCNDNFEKRIYPEYPELLKHLKKIGDNGHFSICTYSEKEIAQDIETFFDLENITPIFTDKINFDFAYNATHWTNVISTDKEHFSGTKSGLLNETIEYGLSYGATDLNFLKEKATRLNISTQIKYTDISGCLLVIALEEGSSVRYYEDIKLEELCKSDKNGEWQEINYKVDLPSVSGDEHKLSIYFWNQGKKTFNLDDVTLKFF